MWNIPTPERLAKIPRLYETEKIPLDEKLIYMHFFVIGCDWFVAEYDGEDLFFGYAILWDHRYAEWGYFDFQELKDIKIDGWLEIDTEQNWQIRKASEIEMIKKLGKEGL